MPDTPPSPETAEAPVTALSRVGPKLADKLARLGIKQIRDLLFHLPTRYENRTQASPIGSLRPGVEAVLVADVQLAQVKLGRRRSLLVRLSDGTGQLDLRFFHFGNAQRDAFVSGARVFCYGAVRRGPSQLEIVHPEYQILRDGQEPPLEKNLTPVYPTTDGLGQGALRRLSQQALEIAAQAGGLTDWLSGYARQYHTLTLLDALRQLHTPTHLPQGDVTAEGRTPAMSRLALEELLAHHLSHRAVRIALDKRKAPRLRPGGPLTTRFLDNLEFQLTGAQTRVAAEVSADLDRETPMYRLVQGDVGSGKTVVAALAVLQTVQAASQTAVMAPTELLAEQHFRNFYNWLEPLGIRVVWLGGKQSAKDKRATLEALATGEAQVAVGTHALFQNDVRFAALALAVIDEQHRFGVHQRQALLAKSAAGTDAPHQLIMTATPIPRTLAMTACAHLDISSIDELPPGRQQVDTAALPQSRRGELIERVALACAEGQQAYWVCPLIEESESLEAEAAEETALALAETLPDLRTGLVHGRMKHVERDRVMSDFRDAKLDLLVATTVIEVGVDVPNASLMIIENAERMGLAQLHQLRGRVGRGNRQSACVLLYRAPLSRTAKSRLGIMRESTDGFVIARKDLELRGPGEVLGTRQTGDVKLRVADLVRDDDLVDEAARLASALLLERPEAGPALVRRWIGEAVSYGEVG
jgi:ATP-dependent DNA helicase RecG